jgi:Holliday junction resolvase RusA-like endonuclease
MRYIIPGDPVPLLRARHAHCQRSWDSQKQINANSAIHIATQHGDRPIYTGALELSITFYFPVPTGNLKDIHPSQLKRNVLKRDALVGTPHMVKPKLSDLIKFIEDVAEKLIYGNSCTIASIVSRKVYAHEARTEFTITEIHID